MTTPAGKASYLNALLPILSRVENAVERAAWLPAIVERGGLDERAAQEELRRALATRATSVQPRPAAPTPPPRARLLPAERYLLALIAEGAEGVPEALRDLGDAELQPLRAGHVLRMAREMATAGGPVTLSALVDRATDDDRAMLTEIGAALVPTEGVVPAECVKELKAIPLKARMAQIQKDLGAATGETQAALLAEKLQLGRAMAEL
jgi:hypothetical protein